MTEPRAPNPADACPLPARDPDVRLGKMGLWVEGAAGGGLLNVVVHIGDASKTLAYERGRLIYRVDLETFAAGLARLVNGESHEASLPRRPLGVQVTRDGWCSFSLGHGTGDQRITMRCRDPEYASALEGARAALERLARERALSWRPAVVAGPEAVRARLERIARRPVVERPDDFIPHELVGPVRAEEPEFEFTYEGAGWHSLAILVGEGAYVTGGSDIGARLRDLLVAGLRLAAGATHAELTFNAEPGQDRLEFDAVPAAGLLAPLLPCRIRAVELALMTEVPTNTGFEGVFDSGLGVAQALYRMALLHFVEDDRWDRQAFAALEGALSAIEEARDQANDRLDPAASDNRLTTAAVEGAAAAVRSVREYEAGDEGKYSKPSDFYTNQAVDEALAELRLLHNLPAEPRSRDFGWNPPWVRPKD